MSKNKIKIAILLGDPSGIGPELVSKLLCEEITNKANIVLIGEKKILEEGNKISGKSQDLKFVEKFEQINFDEGNKFFLDISKGKNHKYDIAKCSKESGESVLESLNLALDLAKKNFQKEASLNIKKHIRFQCLGTSLRRDESVETKAASRSQKKQEEAGKHVFQKYFVASGGI